MVKQPFVGLPTQRLNSPPFNVTGRVYTITALLSGTEQFPRIIKSQSVHDSERPGTKIAQFTQFPACISRCVVPF
ncbi:hypothetical protein J6590_022751 [Homalodisca vitripennis]|nr:hypothetical protein J6590_022751 [Homalodisca vitripennis]